MPHADTAIIGMSCRFPGADNYQEYWDNLVVKENSVRETPLSRWDWRNQHTAKESIAQGYSRWAGFIDNPEYFDTALFGISPREAECMDPQQRLMLEQAWHCIQDAGIDPRTLVGKNVGVFVAAGSYDYKELQERYSDSPEGHEATGVHNSVIANRLSYFFNFHGPSVVVDTACSSSLVAIQQAVSAIQLGQCKSALVGGVGLLLTPTTFVRFGKMGMLSPSGKCSAFDSDANGYVRGEGAGVVMLKPLAQAQADGDRIWGVIKGVAINHGGKVRSLTSPSAWAQAKAIVDAVQQANIPAHSINFIETHGTGTPLGDPIEIHALTRAFNQLQQNANTKHFCGLGAVKANIGHLECAAGMAGLIKVLLALKYKTLPGHAAFKTVNPRIKLEDSPFHIVESTRPWHAVLDSKGNPFPLRAGISSFGFGGVNGHLIVEQPPGFEPCIATEIKAAAAPALLTISAASAKSLQQLAIDYAMKLAEFPQRLNELCAAANQSQPGLIYRKSILANDATEMSSKLYNLQKDNGCRQIRADSKIAFVFSGQGSQYPGMGADLYTRNSTFRTSLDECDRLLRPLLNRSTISLMFDEDSSDINLTQYTQPALFAFEYALAKMWQSLGIQPDFIIGHSIGELTGACIAGVFSLEDAIHIVAKRGQLIGGISAPGKMVAIFAPETEVRQILQSISSPVDIAVLNSPNSTVISGETTAMDVAVAMFEQRGIEFRPLDVSQGFHSALMEPVLEEFHQAFKCVKFSTPNIKLISNLTGNVESQAFCSADYWVSHVRNTVQYQASITTLVKQGVTHLLEIGPSSMMINLAKQILDDQNHDATLIASIKPGETSRRSLLTATGQLFEAGYDPAFTALTGSINPAAVQLPFYPFDHRAYWVSVNKPSLKNLPRTLAAGMPGRRIDVAAQDFVCFEANPMQDFGAYLADHRINGHSLMPAAAYLSCASAALGAADMTVEPFRLSDIQFHLPLSLESTQLRLQTMLMRQNVNDLNWNINIAGRSMGEEEWQIFATAKYAAGSQAKLTENLYMNSLEDFKFIPSVSQHDFYRQCLNKGLTYGAGFQVVTHVMASSGKIYGRLHLPESCKALPENCLAIHPSLLDGSLQLVTQLAETIDGAIPLPVSVSQYTLYRSADKDLLAVARLSETEANCADIWLYTPDGEPVGNIQGLKFCWINAAQIVPPIVTKAQDVEPANLGKNTKPTSIAHSASQTTSVLPSMDQLRNLHAEETHDLLVTSLGVLIANAMRTNEQQLLSDKSSFVDLQFTSLGIDSLTTVDLRKQIRDWLGVDVPAALLLGGASVGEVIELLKQQILLQRLAHSTDENLSASERHSEDEEVFVL
nr:beta-ketoacyl synthase N-terminal-like domain-containing protein [uncultured Pseudomonas sp.]